MRRLTTSIATAALVGALATGGCSLTPQSRSEARFGATVEQVVIAQTLDPLARLHPSSAPIAVRNGPLAAEILRNYRTTTAAPKEIQNDIVVNVGN